MKIGEVSGQTPHGVAYEMDSFVACIQKATSYWGQSASYDCVAALSGMAFAPALHKGEMCVGCWMEFSSDLRARFLGHALGFSVLSTGRPATEGDMAFDEFCARGQAAIARSGVLLIGPTPRWHLHTSWPGDLEQEMLPGRCSNLGCLPGCDGPVKLYLLTPYEPALTRAEATREALKFAAATTLGRIESTDVIFGTAMYDSLLEHLENCEDGLCPADKGDGMACLDRKVCRTHFACLSAGNFLRKATAFVPDLRGNGHLLSAASVFETMAAELSGLTNPAKSADELGKVLLEKLNRIRSLHVRAAAHLDHLCSLL